MSTPAALRPDELPSTIRQYLTAHEARDVDAALRNFTATAVVADDGTTYRGTDEIRGFLSRAGAAFTYTTTLIAAERRGDTEWIAVKRLEGDFPGGVVVLHYRFTMDADLIAELVIAP